MKPMHIYIDEEIDAESIEELRAKAADLAEAAWRRELDWRAELAARPPLAQPYEPLASSETARLWGEKLAREVTAPWLPFPGDAKVPRGGLVVS